MTEELAAPRVVGPAMGDLEFLARLRKQLQQLEVESEEARRMAEPEPPKLTVAGFAKRMGVVTSTVTNVIKRIEGPLGIYLLARIDEGAPKVKRRKLRSLYPEETKKYAAGLEGDGKLSSSEIDPKLTLDGEIWSLYVDLVLCLYTLTRSATAPYTPDQSPPPIVRPIFTPRGIGPLKPITKPHRPSEASRTKYMRWLQHQHDLVTQGQEFIRANRYATVFDLDRLVPGYQANPNEEPLWHPEDVEDFKPGD